MSLIKRFVATVHHSVDRTLAGMENHEAVVDAALRESREAVSRARVRLNRLEKDGKQQSNRITELTSEVELWNERARSVADGDRPRAWRVSNAEKPVSRILSWQRCRRRSIDASNNVCATVLLSR